MIIPKVLLLCKVQRLCYDFKMIHWKKTILSILVMLLMVGCATNLTNPSDPYEQFNRKIFAFNMAMDKYLFNPITTIYVTIIPDPVQRGVSNVFSNVAEIPTVANDILQLKIGHAVLDSWRFAINTVLGFGGVFDVATLFGFKRHYQDLGLTLARWGIKKSSYLVLPFLGPSTIRDAIGWAGYYYMTVYPYLKPWQLSYGLLGFNYIVIKAKFLPADKLVREAFDPYVFVRNAYLQRRDYLIKGAKDQEPVDDDYLLDVSS